MSDRLTLQQLQEQLIQLTQKLQQATARIEWVEQVFETYGVRGLWLSPAKAAPLLGISRDRIMAEIKRAEVMRATNKNGDFVYSVHYRNMQDPEAEEPTWQVHVSNFGQALAIPPDRRKVG